MRSPFGLLLVAAAAILIAGCPAPSHPFIPDDAAATMDATLDGTTADAPVALDALRGDVQTDTGPSDGCPVGRMSCNGVCVATENDTANCGSCGNACPMDYVCAAGACVHMCPAGLAPCAVSSIGGASDGGASSDAAAVGDGSATVCVDLMNSRLNCGACGRTCAATENCGFGRCYLDCGSRTQCTPDGGAAYCTDLTYDHDNCGACGRACPATQMCDTGHCVLSCAPPTSVCLGTATAGDSGVSDASASDGGASAGYCANLTSDLANCGACGHACGPGQSCSGSACHCTGTFTACGASCVNTRTDPMNCGACGTVCAAGSYCSAGACTVCAPRTLCAGGLCTDTTTDVSNCGSCGHACPTGNTCVSSACICPAGSMVCSGTCVNLATDSANCGACGRACPTGNFCSGSVCNADIRTYVTSTPPASVTFMDICSLPGAIRQLQDVDDGVGAPVTIPFTFRFFDGMYTQVVSSADGYLGFGATGMNFGSYGTYMLPATFGPHPAFFVYGRDLYQRADGICFATLGVAPNRRFAWQENDVSHYPISDTHLTWIVYLNEGANTIDVVYQNVAGAGTSGEQANVGMQNADLTRSFVYEYDRAGSITTGLRLRFTPGG